VYKAEVVTYYNISSYRKLPGIMNVIILTQPDILAGSHDNSGY